MSRHKDHKHGVPKKHAKQDRTQPQQETAQRSPMGPQKPERLQEAQMQPEAMGNINVPDRSGVSDIRDRGR